jgi:hypothetical protein
MPSVTWLFDDSFFGGTGVAPLPEFDASDLVGLFGGQLTDPGSTPLYFFSVPEPAAALLLAGLLLAVWARRP